MNELKTDMPLFDFLNAFFGDKKYKDLCKSVRGFAEGFDLADPDSKARQDEIGEQDQDQKRRIADRRDIAGRNTPPGWMLRIHGEGRHQANPASGEYGDDRQGKAEAQPAQ